MKAPTFEQIEPWAKGFNVLSTYACWLGIANNVAIIVVRPPLTWPSWIFLAFWWLPIGTANLILAHVMVRWAIARLKAFERDHPELWEDANG